MKSLADPKKQSTFRILAFFLFLLLNIQILQVFLRNENIRLPVGNYVLSLYYLSYDLGFQPRGLIGTLFLRIEPFLSAGKLTALIYLITSFFYWVVFYRFWRILKNSVSPRQVLAFGFFCFALPTFFLPVLDFGRFDIYMLILFLTCFILVDSGGWKARLFIPLLIVIGILIHEGFFLLCAPTIIALLIVRHGDSRHGWLFISFTGLVALAAMGIVFLSKNSAPPQAEIDQFVASHFTLNGYPAEQVSSKIFSGCSFWENMRATWSAYNLKDQQPYMLIFTIIFSIPAWFVLYCTWGKIFLLCKDRRDTVKLWILLLSTLAPLTLSIGFLDINRWVAMSLFANIFSLFFLMQNFYAEESKKCAVTNKEIIILIGISLFYLVQGTGSIYGFSFVAAKCAAFVKIAVTHFLTL